MAKKIFPVTRSEPALFTLVGISCHIKDYRLSFLINKGLEYNLVRQEDLRIPSPAGEESPGFSFYYYRDEDMRNSFSLLSNRNQDQVLVPDLKQMDFLLLIEGEFRKNRKEELLKSIRSIPSVLMANDIRMTDIRNFEILLTELELHMMRISKPARKPLLNFK